MNKRIFLMILLVFPAVKLKADNYAPVVRIENPKTGSKFRVDEEIRFEGKAIDLEDGELSGESFVWTSDIDGRIGQGSSFSAKLSEGSHIIILTATDSGNSLGRASVFIIVGSPKITKPVDKIEPEPEKSKIQEAKVEKKALPCLEFLFIPPFGSFENLQGRVLNADPNEFVVAVYIMVNGVWWSKPVIKINRDGKWICDITTAENDELAIKIIAYLIPIGYNPPLASGEFWILKEIEEKCLAKIEVTRKIESKPALEPKKLQKELPDPNMLCDRFVPDNCWLGGFCRVNNLLAKPVINDWFRKSIRDAVNLDEEIKQKIYNIQTLLIFSTIGGSLGVIGVFDCSDIEELLKNFEGVAKQIDQHTLLFFRSEKGESLEAILKSCRSDQPVVVRDALKAVDRADVALAIDCEQIRRSSPETWKEMLGDIDSGEMGHIFNDLKLVMFRAQVGQKFNLGIDIVCENTQSVQILSQQLQTICQQMLVQTKGESFPSFSFQIEGTRLIVAVEFELEEVMRMFED